MTGKMFMRTHLYLLVREFVCMHISLKMLVFVNTKKKPHVFDESKIEMESYHLKEISNILQILLGTFFINCEKPRKKKVTDVIEKDISMKYPIFHICIRIYKRKNISRVKEKCAINSNSKLCNII